MLLKPPGASWNLVKAPGTSCGLLEPPGTFWMLLEPPGASKKLLEAPGAYWNLLERSETSWMLLEPPGCSWNILQVHQLKRKLTSAFDRCVPHLASRAFAISDEIIEAGTSQGALEADSGVRIIAVLDSAGNHTLHHALRRNIIGILPLGLGIRGEANGRWLVLLLLGGANQTVLGNLREIQL